MKEWNELLFQRKPQVIYRREEIRTVEIQIERYFLEGDKDKVDKQAENQKILQIINKSNHILLFERRLA